MEESPLFSRAYDLLRESCIQSERMPRSRRAVLGRRMEDAAFGVPSPDARARAAEYVPVMAVRPEEAVRRLRARLAQTSPADRAAEQRARKALPSIAAQLKAAGISRALLFGSLAAGTFREGSDIDVAVEGISPWLLLSLQEDLRAATGERVDLIPLGAANQTLREQVLQTGVEIL